MAEYTILIKVDPYTRAFSYTELTTNVPAATITLLRGDRVTWALDQSLPERTFQIDFGPLNPFHPGKPISFRGSDFAMSAAVRLSKVYPLNNSSIFKYSVSLANGWTDDPHCLVVPEPPDPHHFRNADQDCSISWTDDSETAIILTPSPNVSLHTGTANSTTMVIGWADGQPDTQPFSLTFTTPPNGWPSGTISDGGSGLIAVPVTPHAAVTFTIATYAANHSAITANGTLTVTKP